MEVTGKCFWKRNKIDVTYLEYRNNKIPAGFDGYTILHISDLHNREFGHNQIQLIQCTKEISPDVIVITGDLIDRNRTDINAAMMYISKAVSIAPVFFVSGNHEKKSGVYNKLCDRLKKAHVMILDDTSTILEKNGDKIALLGLKDPAFCWLETFENKLIGISNDAKADFKTLLTHRSEKMPLYMKHNIDLVFSGHSHGGQIRIPLIGGLYAPGQGIFPKYTCGLYVKGNTSMVVSRGLGNSIFPLRILNRPELVVLELKVVN